MVFNVTFNNLKLYRGSQFHCWRQLEYPETTTDLSQVTSGFRTQNFSGDRHL